MSQTSAERVPFSTIGIVGCGLIGCSIAAALKKRGFRGLIIGCGRRGTNLDVAAERGYVDSVESDLGQAAASCDLVVICTPVNRIVEDARVAANACRSGTLITDAGSVKQPICGPLSTDLPPGVTFIGSHPIAGSEKQGCAHASADLFVDRVCVLTPDESTPRLMIARLADFWGLLGMTVIEMSPEAHDRALAQTSHVPHVVAAALAASLAAEHRHLTAGGFQDTTRVAAGDPELWSAILMANSNETAAGIRAVAGRLNDFLCALAAGDETQLRELLRFARQNRDAIPISVPNPTTSAE